jgi:hypothetical protein
LGSDTTTFTISEQPNFEKKKKVPKQFFWHYFAKMAQKDALTVPKERVRKGKSNIVQKIKLNQNIEENGTVFLGKEPV